MYICNKWYVFYVLVDCQLAWLRWDSVQHVSFVVYIHIYIYIQVSQNYVNTYIVEIIYSQIIHDMCKMIYRTVSTCVNIILTNRVSQNYVNT
jgi:hypothetical protein